VRVEAKEGERPEREIHAQHEELAVREVDHAHDAEDEGEPYRDERVDAAQEDGGDDELGDYVHEQRVGCSADARRPGEARGVAGIGKAERAATSAGPRRRGESTWHDWS